MSLQQFDVIAAPASSGYPYLVILQSDLLQGLVTRVGAPLVDASKIDPLNTLWPKVSVNSTAYVVLIPLLMSFSADASATAVTNLSANAEALIEAVDLVFNPPD